MRITLRRSSDIVLGLTTVAVIAASIPFLRVGNPSVFYAFALLVAASDAFEVTLPNGVQYPLGLTPGLGVVLLGHRYLGPHAPAQAICVFTFGIGLSLMVQLVSREKPRLVEACVRILTLAVASSVYAAISSVDAIAAFESPERGGPRTFGGLLLTSVAVFVAVVVMDALLTTAREAQANRLPFRPLFIGRVRSTAALHLAMISVAALLALSYKTLRAWAFPLFLAPLAATTFAYRQFASIKKTYRQTISALSRVPEMAGYTSPGHSARVADLATAIAREMGTAEQEIAEIEYAAFLHDIGRLSLAEPDSEANAMELATVGATIVRETGHFPHVAEMIEKQHLAYRRRGEDTDRSLSVGSRAIKVASAFDDFMNPGGIGLSPRDALEKLYREMTYEFDPAVIQALLRVLEKRAVI